jgi:hypothetical protein
MGAGWCGLELAADGCWRDGAECAATEASAGEAFGARAMLLTSDAERVAAGKSLLTGDQRSGVAVAKRLALLLTSCWQTADGRADRRARVSGVRRPAGRGESGEARRASGGALGWSGCVRRRSAERMVARGGAVGQQRRSWGGFWSRLSPATRGEVLELGELWAELEARLAGFRDCREFLTNFGEARERPRRGVRGGGVVRRSARWVPARSVCWSG